MVIQVTNLSVKMGGCENMPSLYVRHLKEVIHIISMEPINERLTPKPSHKPNAKPVRIDVIGTF